MKKILLIITAALVLIMTLSATALSVCAAGTPESYKPSDAFNSIDAVLVANDARNTINALPDEITLNDREAVENAREMYDKVDPAFRELLSDCEAKLVSAEKKIAELENTKIKLDPMNKDTIITSLNVLWKGLLAIFVVIFIIIIVVKIIQTTIIKITTAPEGEEE